MLPARWKDDGIQTNLCIVHGQLDVLNQFLSIVNMANLLSQNVIQSARDWVRSEEGEDHEHLGYYEGSSSDFESMA